MKRWRGNLALLLTAMIWGFAFVAQSSGMDYMGPFTFHSVRSILGGISLLPLLVVRRARRKEPATGSVRQLVLGGICCGTALCVASCLQQIGIQYTTVGKAGFITSMYVLLVPVLGLLFGRRVPLRIWACVAVAAVGLYLLSISGSFSLSRGDTFCILCAVCFSIHILVVDHFAPHVDGVSLACVQFFVSGLLAAIPMLTLEHPTWSAIQAGGIPLLYAGVASCGIGYTLQIVGQRYAEPAQATLIMSLESVFSVVGGILLLHQIPTGRELLGSLLMFGGVVFAQLPEGVLHAMRCRVMGRRSES
jgi:drug/metabolite transporter (DMT)-like permease